MKMFFLILFTALTVEAHTESDASHRPKSFSYKDSNAVFVDFTEAEYSINYNINDKKADVKAILKINVVEEGYPVFDLIPDPTLVQIDGINANSETLSTPSRETTVRVLNKKLPIGSYVISINVPLTTLVEFTDTGVKNAFWVTDLEDRFFLERYIPTNLEYDRFSMSFNINFEGLKTDQHVFANGKVIWLKSNKVKIEFPDYFTVSSLYYHTTPKGSLDLIEFIFPSVNGKQVPVTVYTAKNSSSSKTLEAYKNKTLAVMNELEADYGAFNHDSVTIYNASLAHMGLGGMEYAGATVTNLSSVSHELFHSYFARGVSPANGNAGWIDEALASWRDKGYNRSNSLFGSSSMASHPPYTRKTDTDAYSFGASFMAYLDGKFAQKGGLKPFLNRLLEKKLFTPIFTEEFISEMEQFYDEKLQDVFQNYVYRKSRPEKSMIIQGHPIHRKMSSKEMQALL